MLNMLLIDAVSLKLVIGMTAGRTPKKANGVKLLVNDVSSVIIEVRKSTSDKF